MSETHRPYSYACHRRQAVARVGVSVRPGRQQVAASIVRVGHRRGGASRAGQTDGVVIGEAFRRSRGRGARERLGLLTAGDQARVRRRHAGAPRCAVLGQRLRAKGRIVPVHRPRGLFVPQGIRVRHREHHASVAVTDVTVRHPHSSYVYWALPETVEFRLDAVPVILPFGIPHR